jgi:hypothetical protein
LAAESSKWRLRDRDIMLGSIEARADSADHLSDKGDAPYLSMKPRAVAAAVRF